MGGNRIFLANLLIVFIIFISGANLCGADLSGAIFCGADLSGANPCSANLCGADPM